MTTNTAEPDKKQQLISAAFQLFYQRGVHQVGINEILSTAAVAKKTLYHHFPAKQELLLAVIAQRSDDWLHWMSTRLALVATGPAALESFFHALHDWFAGDVAELHSFHGCFFTKVALEVQDEAIQQHCRRFRDELVALLRPHVLHSWPQEPQASAKLALLMLLKDGAETTAALQAEPSAALRALQLWRCSIQHPA